VVKKHFGTELERAVDTGADNALVKTSCAGWCKHIVVETVGVSMVGQITGVPIGPHRISCQYASHAVGSTVLRNLFAWFLKDNCVSCPHYQEGSSPGYGRQVVEDIKRRDSEHRFQVQQRKLRIEELRRRLKQTASGFAHSSGDGPWGQSINHRGRAPPSKGRGVS
jgi:hypothetical protein